MREESSREQQSLHEQDVTACQARYGSLTRTNKENNLQKLIGSLNTNI